MPTPLQLAFAGSRKEEDIGLVLPVLIECQLYVVGKLIQGEWQFFSKASPQPERLCITVSESKEALASFNVESNVELKEFSGLDLLKEMPKGQEIVVCYDDGGDYISHDHIDWYCSTLTEAGLF